MGVCPCGDAHFTESVYDQKTAKASLRLKTKVWNPKKRQSRALAIHPPVRTALTPAVGSDFAKVLSKLPPEELERCSELLYNQRAIPVA